MAFATTDGERVEGELRTSARLDVYEVTGESVRRERSVTFAGQPNGASARIAALAGVAIVFLSAVGTSEAVRLSLHGIRARPSFASPRIDLLLEALRKQVLELDAGAA